MRKKRKCTLIEVPRSFPQGHDLRQAETSIAVVRKMPAEYGQDEIVAAADVVEQLQPLIESQVEGFFLPADNRFDMVPLLSDRRKEISHRVADDSNQSVEKWISQPDIAAIANRATQNPTQNIVSVVISG